MLSPRWLIGVALFLVLGFVLSNWIDGNAMFTSAQADTLDAMTGANTVSVTANTGGQINYVNINPIALFTIIGRALTWDYSFFHDIDPATGADKSSDLQMTLFVIRMCFTAITVGVLFQMAYLLRQMLPG